MKSVLEAGSVVLVISVDCESRMGSKAPLGTSLRNNMCCQQGQLQQGKMDCSAGSDII